MNDASVSKKLPGKKVCGILERPWVVALAIVLGMVVGVCWPEAGRMAEPLGAIYMSFLSMCALPIIILSIMSCVSRAAHSGIPRRRLLNTAAMFLLGGVMAACLGIALMLFLGGSISEELRTILGRIFIKADQTEIVRSMGAWNLLSSLVPGNVFSALSSGNFLACVFFSMVSGAALGSTRNASANRIIEGLTTLCDAFYRMMRWGMMILAAGLFCIVAGQFSSMRLEILPTLGRLIALYFAGCAILCAFYALALRRAYGGGLRRVLDSVSSCAGVAFVSASSALAMPLAFDGLERGLSQRPAVSRFVLPLGVAMNRQAYAMLFAMTAMFVLRLQDGEINLRILASICLSSVLAGMAASGSPAAISPMITYVLAPIGLSTAPGIGVLVIISPMIDSVASMTNLCASCSVSGIVDSRELPGEAESERSGQAETSAVS